MHTDGVQQKSAGPRETRGICDTFGALGQGDFLGSLGLAPPAVRVGLGIADQTERFCKAIDAKFITHLVAAAHA